MCTWLNRRGFCLASSEAGVDRRYMSDIENGKRNISINVFDRECNKLWIKICEFFVEVEKS